MKLSSAYIEFVHVLIFLILKENNLQIRFLEKDFDAFLRDYSKYFQISLLFEQKHLTLLNNADELDGGKRTHNIWKAIYKKDLAEAFTNVTVLFHFYLTLPFSNCEEESDFSKLSLIKIKI